MPEKGSERAAAERLEVTFQEADAEAFGDGSFGAVLSTFGVMFAPDQEKAAAELARVCRPGGKIGLAIWTPEGFIGQLFKIIGQYLSPAPGVKSPALWGIECRLHELFDAHAAYIQARRRDFIFRYRSAAHWIEVFRTCYGPVHNAFLALDAHGQAKLEADIIALLARFNRSGDGTLKVPGEYLEVVITRR